MKENCATSLMSVCVRGMVSNLSLTILFTRHGLSRGKEREKERESKGVNAIFS